MHYSCLMLLCCLAWAPGLGAQGTIEIRPEAGQELERAIELERLGQVKDAERVLLKLIRSAENSDPNRFELALALNNVAVLYSATNRFEDAELYFTRSIGILENLPGAEQVAAKARLHLIALYIEAGRPAQATKLNPHELLDRLRSPEDLANVKSSLAALALSRNEIDTAEQIYTELLAFWRDPSRTKVNQETASTLNNLGVIALRRGRFEMARARLEEALTVWQALLGPKNPNLAKAMSNVGMICMRLKQYDAAAMWMGQANEIAQSAFGESHPFTAAVQFAYAEALKKAGRKSEGAEVAKSASAARKMMRNPSTSSYTINYRDLMTTGSRRW